MTDDIVTQLKIELSWIEQHGTESLNDLDHAALLVAVRNEIERLRNSLVRWRMIADKLANEVDAQILDRGLELYHEQVENERLQR
jgi:hypothetical protein